MLADFIARFNAAYIVDKSGASQQVDFRDHLGNSLLTGETAPPLVAPSVTTQPSITGGTTTGSVLTLNVGAASGTPAPTPAIQWLRGTTAISGATGATYTLVAADEGRAISARVTWTNSAGSVQRTSNAITGQAPGPAPTPTLVSAPRFEPSAALTGDNVRLVVGTYAEPGVTVVGELTPTGIELTNDGSNYTFTAGQSGTIQWTETPSLNGVRGATQTATLTVTDAEAPPPDPILSRYAASGAGKIIGHWNAAGATGAAGSVTIPDATGNNSSMATKAASVTDVQDRVAVDGPGYIGLPSGINLRGKRLFILLNPTAYVDDQEFMFDKQATHETMTRFDVRANNTWRWRMFHPVNNGGGGGPTTLTGAWAANIGTPVLIEMQYATDRRLSLTVNGTQVYNAVAGDGTNFTHAFVNDFFMRDFGGAPFATTGFPCEFLDILLMQTDGAAATPDDISAVRSALLAKGGIA